MNKTPPPALAWNRSRNPFEILQQAVNAQGSGNLEEAERRYNLVLAALPENFEALNFLAIIHGQRGDHAEAARLLGRALKINPWSAETHANLGRVQFEMNERASAAESYVKALTLKPDFALALGNYSVILRRFGRLEEALACCDKAIALQPDYADAIEKRGKVLLDLGRNDEAVAAYDKAWSLRPDSQYGAGARLQARMELCDWTDFDFECSRIVAGVDRGALVTAPFSLVGIASSPSVQLKCAKLFIADKFAAVAPPIRHDRPRDHDRIHVAYLSNDFGDYPASLLLAGLFERHDRLRFRTTAIAFGADDGSEMRSRLNAHSKTSSMSTGRPLSMWQTC
jgi:protein O-GlcNAc transferase